jgi:O-antigen/teichoic acid export membrane protein
VGDQTADPVRDQMELGRHGDSGHHLGSLARGGALNLAGVVTSTVFGFALVVIITRGLGTTNTGLFFESVAVFQILATVAHWGADVGVVRMIPRYAVLQRLHDVRNVVWSGSLPAVIVGSAFSVALVAFAEPLGSLLTNGRHGAEMAPMVRVLAPFIPMYAVYTVLLGATRGFGTMVPTTVIDKLGRASAQPACALLVILAGWSTIAIAVAWAIPFGIGLAVATLWLAALIRRSERSSDDEGPSPMSRVFGEFWRFTAPRGLAALFAVATLWLGTLLIGTLRSTAEAGVYAAAARYLTLGQFIGVAISQVVAPMLSQLLASEDRARAKTIYATATAWLMGLAWPLYLTMVILGPALLSVFGGEYRAASPVLTILGSAMLVATLVGPVDMVLLMAGKSSWNLFNTLVAVVVNVVMSLLLIPPLGAKGAAVAWASSILVNNLLPLVQVWRSVGLHPFGRGTIAAGGSALLVFGLGATLVRVAFGPGLFALAAVGTLGGVAYLGLLWRFRRPLELAALRQITRRRGRGAVLTG